jgi:hypothetical protein
MKCIKRFSNLDASRKFREHSVEASLSDRSVGVQQDVKDAELVADNSCCSDQYERVEEDGVAQVSDKVIRSVPEEDAPEPSGDASSPEIVVANNSLLQSNVCFLPELIFDVVDHNRVSITLFVERQPSRFMPSLCFSRFQNVIKHVDRRVLSEVHGFRTTSISLIFGSHILGEVNQQELADDLLHAGFALKPDFIDLLLLDLLPVSRRILFIFLELSVELSNEGRVHVVSQRIVKLRNSVRVKFVLLFGEEFVLSSRVHHEAFFQGLTHIFVVAHNDLSVRVT